MRGIEKGDRIRACISVETVEVHRVRMMERLGVKQPEKVALDLPSSRMSCDKEGLDSDEYCDAYAVLLWFFERALFG
jgi:hypothetical protein